MPLTWSDAQSADFRDPYVDFSWMLRQRRRPAVGDHIYQPVFIRLKGAKPRPARKELLRLIDDPTAPLLMEPHERAILESRAAGSDPDAGLPDEYALYIAQGTAADAYAALFDTLDTGTPVALDPSGAPEAPAPTAAAAQTSGQVQPIVAIIDDGLAFLNARFRKDGQTRFHAVWLQALERSGPGAKSMYLGEVMTRGEIDALLARGTALNEPAEYAAVNARLARYNARRSTDHGTSHGTHVLDLAAGADPQDADDPARDWPLIGVQLPPQAVADTSGTRFESYMVQAMRWILREAQQIDPRAPVIVNLSMGMLAGPKDGTRFAEYQIAREAAAWEATKGQPVRVVWSFGNDYRKRLVARFDYPEAHPRSATDRSIEWVVQPGDQTESFLELRSGAGQPLDGLHLSLTTPAGLSSGFAPLAPGESRSLTLGSEAVARIYHVPDYRLDDDTVQRAYYLIALAPTASCHGEALAPAGTWRLACRHAGSEALSLHLQIQRDDSLTGYRARARQSYFDSADGYGWSDTYLDHSALEADCVIRHEGSHNALASSTARQVFLVGAARQSRETAQLVPADYTGEGADWSVPGPTAATVADRSRIRPGVQGSGTLSGSTRFLNGTSAAAGRLTRALALSHAQLTANASGPHSDDFDRSVLTLSQVPDAQTPRLGAYVVGTGETALAI
ncbi:S8 family serine peptidase [Salipiger abyssi]|uniref:S8 family serine peptidase n=1 Tax=Salipiger abyssi TaxID=1250539 RepID=UPI004059DEBE